VIIFLLQFPYFGCDFAKNFQHIRRICFKFFASSRSKYENFVAKIITQQVYLFMVKGGMKIRIPNPHRGDISKYLLAEILRQAGLSNDIWGDV